MLEVSTQDTRPNDKSERILSRYRLDGTIHNHVEQQAHQAVGV
jgi:hypothetical protein